MKQPGISFSRDEGIGPASGDIRNAREIAEGVFAQQEGRRGEEAAWRFLMGVVRSTVRPLVRERWKDIVKLGDALVVAQDQTLTYQQCRAVLGLDTEAIAA